MENRVRKWVGVYLLSGFLMLSPYIYVQESTLYSGGQAIFVQSPYYSSVYTHYQYVRQGMSSNRLPNYTTNQTVFVQQPYATTLQIVDAYPTSGRYFPYKDSHYATPSDYPSTVSPAYPFATVRSYTSSPYTTTNQYPTYNPNSRGSYTTTSYTYPYTLTGQPVASVTNQPTPSYSTTANTAYPVYQTGPNPNYPTFSSYTIYPNSPNAAYGAPGRPSPATYQSPSPYPLMTALPETNIRPTIRVNPNPNPSSERVIRR